MINPIISECSNLDQKKYKSRYDSRDSHTMGTVQMIWF